MAKPQFTLRTVFLVLTATAVALGLSTPPEPPSEELKMQLKGDRFGPTYLFEASCLVGVVLPPCIAYGVRRRWQFSLFAVGALTLVASRVLYCLRYELGWHHDLGRYRWWFFLRYLWNVVYFPLGALLASAAVTWWFCWITEPAEKQDAEQEVT